MQFLSWFRSKPGLADEAPKFDAPPPVIFEEDDPEPEVAPGDGPKLPELDDVFTMMEYRSAVGALTRRRVTFRQFQMSAAGQPSLVAWCHERRAIRTFRLDRIECFITIDGEVQTPAEFWADIDVAPPQAVVSTRMPAGDGIGGGELALRRTSRHQVRVLAALSRCDGHYHPAEIEAIVQHALIEGEDAGVFPADAEVEAFARYVSRLRPTRETLTDSLDALFDEDDGRDRLSGRRLRRFWKAANAVAAADGIVAEPEVAFLLEMRGLIDATGEG